MEKGKGGGICNEFKNTGSCKFGAKCKYSHEQISSGRGGYGGRGRGGAQ